MNIRLGAMPKQACGAASACLGVQAELANVTFRFRAYPESSSFCEFFLSVPCL